MDDLFERLFEGHPDAWHVVELDGERITMVWANRAQAERFGMTQEEIRRRDPRTLVPPEHYASWLSMLRGVVEEGRARSFDFKGPPQVGGFVRATFIPLGSGPSGHPRFGVQIRDETARQTAEQALQRSEARLEQAQAIGQVGDWERDLSTGAATWSRQMFRIFAWPSPVPPTLEELQSLVHPADRAAVEQFYVDALASRQSHSIVFRLTTPTGEMRRISATAVCVRDSQGKPVKLCGVSHDISAIEEALESAQRNAVELEILFEDNVNGVYFSLLDEPIEWNDAADKDALAEWALDHARPVRVNRAMCAITGATEDMLIGRPVRSFFPDAAVAREQFRTLYDAGRVHMSRVPRLRADGSRWLADFDLVVMRDEDGRITGQFGVVRDVTAQEAAAEALRQSEARLALALDSAGFYPWSLDAASGRVQIDPSWAARFGYTVEAFSSQAQAMHLIHPSDQAQVLAALSAHLAGQTPSVSVVLRQATRTGAWAWVEVHGKVTQRDAAGAPQQVTGICRDITEQRALEQRLLVAERMASLGTLAAGVGHEINNPLTYVSANLALMDDLLAQRDRADPARGEEELRRMLADARDGVSRIVRIVRDLRSLTRSGGGPRQPIDVLSVLERSLELAEHQVRHRARVVRKFEPVPTLFGDEGRLIQLFLNLLVNAAQAIPEGAAESNWISVAARRGGAEQVVVEIGDSGVGMSAEVLARIFDPFFTTKSVGEGTGLGLPICHSIVNEMGGSIEVESQPGAGSTFRVRLPLGTEERVAAPATPASVQGSAAKLRVLIIDDEPTVGRLLTRILHSCEVVVETRAADALERLRAGQRFDRILCDVMMPEMSGMDFYQALGKLDASMLRSVIFMTGGAFSARAATFLASVPNPTIEKPFEPEPLRKAVYKPLEDALTRGSR